MPWPARRVRPGPAGRQHRMPDLRTHRPGRWFQLVPEAHLYQLLQRPVFCQHNEYVPRPAYLVDPGNRLCSEGKGGDSLAPPAENTRSIPAISAAANYSIADSACQVSMTTTRSSPLKSGSTLTAAPGKYRPARSTTAARCPGLISSRTAPRGRSLSSA